MTSKIMKSGLWKTPWVNSRASNLSPVTFVMILSSLWFLKTMYRWFEQYLILVCWISISRKESNVLGILKRIMAKGHKVKRAVRAARDIYIKNVQK